MNAEQDSGHPGHAVESSANIGRRTMRALRWNYGRSIVIVTSQLAYTAIMARLLDPPVFGLFAMALVAVNLGKYFVQTGLAMALVQKRDLREEDIRATFTSSLTLGLLAGGTLLAAAPLVSRYFEDPALLAVIRVMAANFLILGFGTTASALLQRSLSFRAIAVSESLAYLIGYLGVGVTMASAGFGVWSLVASLLSTSALTAVFFYVNVRHSLRPIVRASAYRRVASYGSLASVTGVVEFTLENLDTLVIGRFLGTAHLGVFNRASMLIRLPVHHLAFGLVRVMFPSFSRLQDDPPAFRDAYYRGVAAAASLLAPVSAGAAIAAPAIVMVLLGDGWLDAIPVLAVLALVAPLHLLSQITATAWGALGRMATRLFLQAVFLPALLVAFLVAAPFGLTGIATALLCVELVRYVTFAWWTARLLRPARAELWRAYALPVLSGAISYAAVASIDALMIMLGVTPLLRLLADMSAGAVTLGIIVWVGPLRYMRPMLVGALGRGR